MNKQLATAALAAMILTGTAQAAPDMQSIRLATVTGMLSTATAEIVRCNAGKNPADVVNMDAAEAFLLVRMGDGDVPAIALAAMITQSAMMAADAVINGGPPPCDKAKQQLGPHGTLIPGLWKTDDRNGGSP